MGAVFEDETMDHLGADSEENPEHFEVLAPQELLSRFAGVNVAGELDEVKQCRGLYEPLLQHLWSGTPSVVPFRHLVSLYNTHITHTPMILAQEFSRSATGRRSDFSTSTTERGIFTLTERAPHSGSPRPTRRRVRGSLIAQFAANDPKVFADACELIHPHVDGVDLNCGCPQKWAYQEKIGSYLLRQPDTVRDLIRAARDRTGWSFPVSIKIRIDSDLQRTNQLVETAIQAGASHITVHGRNRHQLSTVPVDLSGIQSAVECARGRIPVVANGDAWSFEESEAIRKATGVQGVMSGRGLLSNPALFAGYTTAPADAVSNFLQLSTAYTLPFPLAHKHVAFMLESAPLLRSPVVRNSDAPSKGVPMTRAARAHFHSLVSMAGVLDFLEQECEIDCNDGHGVDPWKLRR